MQTGPAQTSDAFGELDAKIEEAMKAYAIPGVAVAVITDGQEHVKGFGVTNIDHPVPVDEDTVFRIGSTTKTFTGTAIMRLVDEGKVDLDAPIRQYLPDFAVADPDASATVTVRQLLNHTSGWLGDDLQDFGRGDDALTRYVGVDDPATAADSAGHAYSPTTMPDWSWRGGLSRSSTGSAYEDAVQELLLDPLELSRTRFFSDQIIGLNVAAAHNNVDGKAVVDTGFWAFSTQLQPDRLVDIQHSRSGALRALPSRRRRHAEGTRLMSKESLTEMRSNPGVGGTLQVELTGMGVSWMLRPSAENETIVQHGGTWAGQRSGFFMVPSRNFAMTVLTNSEGGGRSCSTTCSPRTGRFASSPESATCPRRHRS